MKTFLSKIGLFLSIQLVIAAVLLMVRPADPQGFFAAAIDKHRWANQQQQPRLLLVGGSNLAFGIASETLQDSVGYIPVNLALTAGLGLDYILNEARSLARNRDVIVVSLEYEHFLKDHTSPTHVQMLLDACPTNACYFSASQIKTLLDDGLITLHNQLRQALHGAVRSDGKSVYRRGAFNQYGDVIGHHDRQSRYHGYLKQDPDQLRKVKMQQIDEAHLDGVIDRLNLFSRQCQRKGAWVGFTFPPLAEDAYALWQHNLKRIEQRLQQHLAMPLLLRPAEVVYPTSEFYDTCYHLNARSKRHRTTKLAASLQVHLPAKQVAGRVKTQVNRQ